MEEAKMTVSLMLTWDKGNTKSICVITKMTTEDCINVNNLGEPAALQEICKYDLFEDEN